MTMMAEKIKKYVGALILYLKNYGLTPEQEKELKQAYETGDKKKAQEILGDFLEKKYNELKTTDIKTADKFLAQFYSMQLNIKFADGDLDEVFTVFKQKPNILTFLYQNGEIETAQKLFQQKTKDGKTFVEYLNEGPGKENAIYALQEEPLKMLENLAKIETQIKTLEEEIAKIRAQNIEADVSSMRTQLDKLLKKYTTEKARCLFVLGRTDEAIDFLLNGNNLLYVDSRLLETVLEQKNSKGQTIKQILSDNLKKTEDPFEKLSMAGKLITLENANQKSKARPIATPLYEQVNDLLKQYRKYYEFKNVQKARDLLLEKPENLLACFFLRDEYNYDEIVRLSGIEGITLVDVYYDKYHKTNPNECILLLAHQQGLARGKPGELLLAISEPGELLLGAIEKGDKRLVELLINEYPEAINYQNPQGENALIVAIRCRQWEIRNFLYEKVAGPEDKRLKEFKDDNKSLSFLKQEDYEGRNALYWSVENHSYFSDDYHFVQKLVKNGLSYGQLVPKTEAEEPIERTLEDYKDTLYIQVDRDSDFYRENKENYKKKHTELVEAVRNGNIDKANALLTEIDKNYPNFNFNTRSEGNTLLSSLALSAFYDERIYWENLKKYQEDPDDTEAKNKAETSFSNMRKKLSLMEALVNRGADINYRTYEGYTPFQLALQYFAPDCHIVAESLISLGAYPLATSKHHPAHTPHTYRVLKNGIQRQGEHGLLYTMFAWTGAMDKRPPVGTILSWHKAHDAILRTNTYTDSAREFLIEELVACASGLDTWNNSTTGESRAKRFRGMLYAYAVASLSSKNKDENLDLYERLHINPEFDAFGLPDALKTEELKKLVNYKDKHGRTLISRLNALRERAELYHRDEECKEIDKMIALVLDAGATAEEVSYTRNTDKNEETILETAAQRGGGVAGALINASESENGSLLIENNELDEDFNKLINAIQNLDTKVVYSIIDDDNFDLNVKGSEGYTPLQFACSKFLAVLKEKPFNKRNLEKAAVLIVAMAQHGAPINTGESFLPKMDEAEIQKIFEKMSEKDRQIAEEIYEDTYEKLNFFGNKRTARVISYENREMYVSAVRSLLEMNDYRSLSDFIKKNINVLRDTNGDILTNRNGENALHILAQGGSMEALMHLKESEDETVFLEAINTKDRKGYTPFDRAILDSKDIDNAFYPHSWTEDDRIIEAKKRYYERADFFWDNLDEDNKEKALERAIELKAPGFAIVYIVEKGQIPITKENFQKILDCATNARAGKVNKDLPELMRILPKELINEEFVIWGEPMTLLECAVRRYSLKEIKNLIKKGAIVTQEMIDTCRNEGIKKILKEALKKQTPETSTSMTTTLRNAEAKDEGRGKQAPAPQKKAPARQSRGARSSK